MTENRLKAIAAMAFSLILAAVSSGCGGASEAGPADPARARQVLRDTLDAWKNGESLDAPARFSPPVHVDDEDWLSGVRLVDYRIGPGDEVTGAALRCPVVLTFHRNRGKARTATVVYDVTTDPAPVVTRLDRP
jgi:hypothetical protein